MADKKKDSGFAANWRPDFRDNDALPDVKAVRTNFMVNLVAVALACLVAVWFGIKEFQAMSLQTEIDNLKASIQDASGKNRAALKLSKEFTQLSPKVDDLVAFYDGYQFPLNILLPISESRPETIALESFTLSKAGVNKGSQKKPNMVYTPRVTLTAILKGESVEALQELDKYKVTLQELPIFEGKLESINVSQPRRVGNHFEFTIVINLKEPV